MPLMEVLKPEKKMLTIGLCCAAIIILVIMYIYNNYKNGQFKFPNVFKRFTDLFSSSREKEHEILTSEFVEDLTSESQISEIFEPSSESKILLVHTNWCGHCRNMMRAFMEAAKSDESSTKRTKWFRIDGSKAPNFVKRKDLKGFPTIYGISADNGVVSQHSGSRDVESLLLFSRSLNVSLKNKSTKKHKNEEMELPPENNSIVQALLTEVKTETKSNADVNEESNSEKSVDGDEEEEEEEDENEQETETT
jgi:hypothetical protein